MANMTPYDIANVALMRLAAAGLQPTPENYERAYREIAGSDVPPPAQDPEAKGSSGFGRKPLRDGGLSSS